VAIRRLLPDLPASDAGPLEAHYRAEFSRRRVSSLAPLYPGARAALDELARRPGILMGIATGKSRRGLGHAIAEHDLAPFFTTTQVADNHPSKPHPSMLIAALHETGTEARNAVMVGDTRYDMEMARAAGMRGIGVAWGYHPAAQLRAAGAEIVVDDFAGLLPALDAMCEGV
jgi:phosphoglycolate phosphatase